MQKLGGWWRLWIVFVVIWTGANLYDFFQKPRELDSPEVFIGRIGDTEGIIRKAYNDSASQCERWGIGRSIRLERRIGIPDNAMEESEAALGRDNPNFPNWPKDKTLELPSTKKQPYLVARISCSAPGTVAGTVWFAFGPPLLILIIGLVMRWIWRGFRPKKASPS